MQFIKCEHAADYVTAEQHALDNPGHYTTAFVKSDKLILVCRSCNWWDEQLI